MEYCADCGPEKRTVARVICSSCNDNMCSGHIMENISPVICNCCYAGQRDDSGNYIPLDQWAKNLHPELLANINAHIDILVGDTHDSKERYNIVRGLLQYIRQEFDDK